MDAATPYDGDESEIYDNKSDNASTLEMELADEQEQWMREELELAQKEELAKLSPLQNEKDPDQKEEWRQQAMALLNDDTQMERDFAIVAALNERLQGLKDMEEEDRQRAIECIERHQSNLEEQQDQLSALLDSAIAFLKNLDTSPSMAASEKSHPKKESPEPAGLKTDPLCCARGELETTSERFIGPGDFIAEKLEQICANDGQSFTRSTFEQHTEQRTTTGGGAAGAPSGKLLETRGHGSLNNPGGRIPYCESCKQQIRGAFVLATGLAWCPEHFVCAYRGCGRRLLECGFVEESGSKYCEGCFEAHIAPRCAKCSKPIISDCLNAMQKKWHPTCFTCAHCHKPFGNTAFYLENGLAYCESDWNALFTTKCVSCKYPIEAGDRWVEALGNAFHSNCFNCTRCHSNLEGESFFAKNGQPYCKMHA
nr:Zinc finger domain containing protein [Haemonchus contortus]